MIDPKMLKSLIRMMVENEITEMDLKDGEEQISLKRGAADGVPQVTQVPQVMTYSPQAAPAPQPAASTPAAPEAEATAGDDAGLVPIMSPMVGTFYTAPNPDSEDFVKPGSQVTAETVVCIVEAMKVFNEIKSEVKGTIEKVLVENGQAVDCDTKLFLVRP